MSNLGPTYNNFLHDKQNQGSIDSFKKINHKDHQRLMNRSPLGNAQNRLNENVNRGDKDDRFGMKTILFLKDTNKMRASSELDENNNHPNFQMGNPENLANLCKNFKITYDDSSHELSYNPFQRAESFGKIQADTNLKEDKEEAVTGNPTIAPFISESLRQIDKVNKMLEEHRKKKANPTYLPLSIHDRILHQGLEKNFLKQQPGLFDFNETPSKRVHTEIIDSDSDPELQLMLCDQKFSARDHYFRNLKPKSAKATIGSENRNMFRAPSNKEKENRRKILLRQQSFGKLSERPRNSPLMHNESNESRKIGSRSFHNIHKNTNGFENSSFSPISISNPKRISLQPEDKYKLKGESRQDIQRSLKHEFKSKIDDKPKFIPKIIKKSIDTFKKDKILKENLIQKPTVVKPNQSRAIAPLAEEVFIAQNKILRQNDSEYKVSKSKVHNHHLKTPYFASIEQDKENILREMYFNNMGGQISNLANDIDSRNKNSIMPKTFGESTINKDQSSIPSSSKLFKNIYMMDERRKTKGLTSLDSGFGIDSGYTELFAPTNDIYNKISPLDCVYSDIFNKNKSIEFDLSQIPDRKPSEVQILQNNDSISTSSNLKNTNPKHIEIDILKLYSSVESGQTADLRARKHISDEDLKIEIMEDNLKRLQKEYLFSPQSTILKKDASLEIKSGLSTNTSSQVRNLYVASNQKDQSSDQPTSKEKQETNKKNLKDFVPSYESLLKSYQLRQNKASPISGNSLSPHITRRTLLTDHISSNEASNHKAEHLGTDWNLVETHRNVGEVKVYSRNTEWLSAKRNKIDNLNLNREKEQLKECTFKPNLMGKSLRPNISVANSTQSLKSNNSSHFKSTERSDKENQGYLQLTENINRNLLKTKVTTTMQNKKPQGAYRQIHEVKRTLTPTLQNDRMVSPQNKRIFTSDSKKAH